MIHSPSVLLIALDLSYKDTGVCVASSRGTHFDLIEVTHFESNSFQSGFEGLVNSSAQVQLLGKSILSLLHHYEDYIFIVEMPYKSQSAEAALAIGMIWGMIRQFKPILIDPSFVKAWSGSKSGDKKEKVLEEVKKRWTPTTLNDNVIDAVGIAMAAHDLIRIIHHEQHQTNSQTIDSKPFNLSNEGADRNS